MKKIKILLAEDDKNLGNIVKNYLEAKNYDVTLAVSGIEALSFYNTSQYDFCVLDVMMPQKDGFTVASEIRALNKNIPIIFLTAKSLEEDRLKGFRVGADDYLTKPFSMEELIMRIEVILKRTGYIFNKESKIQIGKYLLDFNSRMLVFDDNNKRRLTSRENNLLKLLCDNMNDVLDRGVALNKIWKDDSYFNARSMDVYIAKLRKYLAEDPNVELINVHGVGFKLVVMK